MKKEEASRVTSSEDLEKRTKLESIFFNNPVHDSEIILNLGLFSRRQLLSRIIFLNELYKKIIDVHGVVIEFGVRWGQNLALFSNFRGMYEPYNYNRKIIGFDTFSGFPPVSVKDGKLMKEGMYNVAENYDAELNKILNYHESESPLSHIKKYDLIKGDASNTFKDYLDKNPHTIVSFAYFDFDLYEPTKVCLELLLERVTKGTIIAFDELNSEEFPGETIALMETIGLKKYSLKRSHLNPLISYLVVE